MHEPKTKWWTMSLIHLSINMQITLSLLPISIIPPPDSSIHFTPQFAITVSPNGSSILNLLRDPTNEETKIFFGEFSSFNSLCSITFVKLCFKILWVDFQYSFNSINSIRSWFSLVSSSHSSQFKSSSYKSNINCSCSLTICKYWFKSSIPFFWKDHE